MVELNTRCDVISFSHKVIGVMNRNAISMIHACCYLNTYPNDTHYCSGHGIYGDNRSTGDCPLKSLCEAIHYNEPGIVEQLSIEEYEKE